MIAAAAIRSYAIHGCAAAQARLKQVDNSKILHVDFAPEKREVLRERPPPEWSFHVARRRTVNFK